MPEEFLRLMSHPGVGQGQMTVLALVLTIGVVPVQQVAPSG